jgi:hypothetical protein
MCFAAHCLEQTPPVFRSAPLRINAQVSTRTKCLPKIVRESVGKTAKHLKRSRFSPH